MQVQAQHQGSLQPLTLYRATYMHVDVRKIWGLNEFSLFQCVPSGLSGTLI